MFRPSSPRSAARRLAPLIFVAGLVLLFARPASAQAPTGFDAPPYLQYLSTNSVTVRFETPDASSAVVVLSAATGSRRTVEDSTRSRFHSIHIEGLKPASAYSYQVQAGDASASAAIFTTAPDDPKSPFDFILWGDSRSGDDVHAAIVREIQSSRYDFIVGTGDVVLTGPDIAGWQRFFQLEAPLLQSHCLFATIGNHELEPFGGRGNYLRFLGPTGTGSGPSWFTYRWGNTRFFSLDSMKGFDGAQLDWLRTELQNADHEQGLQHRFAVTHQSPYSSGPHGPAESMNRYGVPSLLREHHVELIAAGHDHMYERGEVDGLKYIITGGAGAPLYKVGTRIPGSQNAVSVHHFTVMHVDGDQVTLTVHLLGGATLEQCSFRTGQPWSCDTRSTPQAPSASSSAGNAPSQTGVPRGAPTSTPSTLTSRCGCSTPGARPIFAPAAAIGALACAWLARRRTARAHLSKRC